MSHNADEKESPPPSPPRQEGEVAMLAQVQNADEDAILPGGFIPPWAGYGRFSTVMGRRTKAEFRDEFYKRNAYVRSFFVARDHLRAYQECHVVHQRRRFAQIVAYKQDLTVAMGSIAHSSSKNRLEEILAARQRECILARYIVQFSEVNTQTQ